MSQPAFDTAWVCPSCPDISVIVSRNIKDDPETAAAVERVVEHHELTTHGLAPCG